MMEKQENLNTEKAPGDMQKILTTYSHTETDM